MKEIIAVILATLQAAGKTVYEVESPDRPTFPYAVVWTTPGRYEAASQDHSAADIRDLIRVTSSAYQPGIVVAQCDDILATLSRRRFQSEHWLFWLTLFDARPVEVDRSIRLPETSTHPFYAVQVFQLNATPLT